MRKFMFFALTACLMALCASCSNDTDIDDRGVIVEPPYVPMFSFGSDGVPFRSDHPQLSDEMQALLKSEYVGYVWTRMNTNEIDTLGFVSHMEYYDPNSTRPDGFYILSEKEVIRYVHVYDLNTPSRTQGAPKFHVWSIYCLSGKWYFDCVEPLREVQNSDGTMRTVWGTSHYIREPKVDIYY